MAHLATELIRTTVRAFYHPEQVLVIDALVFHSTLTDSELATVCGTPTKSLRKWCGRLKEDGLLSIQTRAERRADGTSGYHGAGSQMGKERVSHRDWYYLNYHRAIDSIKYRMHKLTKHMESLGMPTTEKKDLSCPRCKSQYTELEVMDRIDMNTGQFLCHRCGHALDPVEEEERANENESMKRLNQQLEKLLQLLQKIDAASVPENDFQTAEANRKPIVRHDSHPGAKMEVVDLPNSNLQSTKGLEIKPEKIAVQVHDDEDVKKENATAEAKAKKEREAKQNALPSWITHSTVQEGEITTVGAKEEHQRRQRAAHTGDLKEEDADEKVPVDGDDDIMAAYWKELEREKEAQKAQEAEDEEDDDEEDEFEDVDVSGGGNTPANGVNGNAAGSTGMNTPHNVDSSNATDDERDAKRVKIEEPSASNLRNGINGRAGDGAVGTPAASDEDDDELEFENV